MSSGIKRYSDLASQAVIFGNYREKANFFIKITPQIYTILGRIIQNVIYTSICSFVIAFLMTICVGTSITRAGVARDLPAKIQIGISNYVVIVKINNKIIGLLPFLHTALLYQL